MFLDLALVDDGDELEAVAHADSKPVSRTVREAIDLLIEERGKDRAFPRSPTPDVEEDRAILDRLARFAGSAS